MNNNENQSPFTPKQKRILYIAVAVLSVIVIALVSFLIKTGVLSAAVIGIKKLWEWFRKK